MRIAIDGRVITNKTTGVGQYTEHLVRSLLHIDRNNHYILFLIQPNDSIQAPNLTKVNIEGYERMLLNRWWENFLLQDLLEKHNADLYFSPAYALPFLPRYRGVVRYLPLPSTIKKLFDSKRRYRYVVTIHDMISYIHPEYFTPKMRMWQRFFVPNALQLSDKIIAVSQTTKDDIIRLFHVEQEKIKVIAPWFDQKYSPVTDENILREVRTRYSLPDKFILYLGTIEPRKNIVGLVNAYAQLPEELQKQYTLAIGGGLGWFSEPIVDQIKQTQSIGKIMMLDYVEHQHLPALYSLASLFVFPSFYEGFGSPPVEAMACGTPVITSNISAIPGVVGDAALLIDPNSTTQISEAIQNVLTTPSLQASLRQKGLEQVKTFNWRFNAEETLRLFEETIR